MEPRRREARSDSRKVNRCAHRASAVEKPGAKSEPTAKPSMDYRLAQALNRAYFARIGEKKP